MSTQWVFNGVDEVLKTRLQAYWEKKWPRLQRLLSNYRPDLVEVRLTLYQHQQNSSRTWYELRVVVQLPTGTVSAEVNDDDPRVALDKVTDTLRLEITRHKELVRRDYVFKRKRRHRDDLSAAGPLLQHDHEKGRRKDFFGLLRPLVGYLRDHARRELNIYELNGLLHEGEYTVSDLFDEVATRAWQQFPQKPKNKPLDLWLIEILHDTLDEWVKQQGRTPMSLEEETELVSPAEVPQIDDQEWWSMLLGYDESESSMLEDLVQDLEATEDFEQIEAKDAADRILPILNTLPKQQRQAFLLHVLEDFKTDEIAMIQNRPEQVVKAEIETAVRTLKDLLHASRLEQHAAAITTPVAIGAAGEENHE
jgi:RNA polymerase sigma factor (sigma-70 family)